MNSRIGKFLTLALLVGLVPACQSGEAPPPYDPDRAPWTEEAPREMLLVQAHDCTDTWGAAADDLAEALNSRTGTLGRGWACRLQDLTVYDAIVGALRDVQYALNETGDPNCSGVRNLPNQEDVRTKVEAFRPKLAMDRKSKDTLGNYNHLDPFSKGWIHSGGTPTAISKLKDQLLQAIKDALDM